MRIPTKGGVLLGGVLPVLQIACERLYKQAKAKRARGVKRWSITAADYEILGDLDKQVDLYLDENILKKISHELPGLNDAQRDEELALWKDLLNQLVVVEPDKRALTIIRSWEELRKGAEELRCKVDFKKMIDFLAEDAQRILREDRRTIEVPESLGNSDTVYYYSLGHDAIAAALSKWRETRELVLSRRSFVRNVLLNATIVTAATFLVAAVAVFVGFAGDETWQWSGVGIIMCLLLAAGVLLAARTRISESLARKIVNSIVFHGLFGETERQSRQTQDAIRRIQHSFNTGQAPEPSISEREVLKGAEELLKAKPEREYTAADWEQRAFAAYTDGKVDLAAEYFRQAETATDATPMQRALYTFNRGILYGQLQRSEDELAVYEDVVRRFGTATEPAVREQVAKVLFNKGVTLGQLQRSAEALAAYDEVTARFQDAAEPAVREQVAKALNNKGVTLGQLQRSEDELAVYEDVVRRFGTATDPGVQESVAGAMNGIGFQMLCQAKKARIEGDESFAQEYLLKAQEKIRMADERRPENPSILGNLAYIAFLLDQRSQAYHFLSRAIAIGGEKIRQSELRDAEIYKLPQDEEFQALVLSI
jgi:tetratricopeptide (TPR) repeat protein